MNRNTSYCDIIGLLRGEGKEITKRERLMMIVWTAGGEGQGNEYRALI